MSRERFTHEEQARLLQTKAYLHNHLHQRLTIAQLARRSAMCPKRFKEGFQLFFGYLPGEYVHRARLLTAQVLLRQTRKPIKEIASLCGYRYYKNFLTAYRRFFGERASKAKP
jgi:AraC family transcriptional regulator